MSSPAARREAALRLMAERGLSQRHVCRLLEVDPKTVRRPERVATKRCARVCARSLASGAASATGGSGSCSQREGMIMNGKKLYRLYCEEGLAVRRRRARKRATGTRAPIARRRHPISAGSSIFVSDCLCRAAAPAHRVYAPGKFPS